MNKTSLAIQLHHAARAVQAVLSGRDLGSALQQTVAEHRPAAQALAFHCMRHLGQARANLAQMQLRHTPDKPLLALLYLGLSLLESRLNHPAKAIHGKQHAAHKSRNKNEIFADTAATGNTAADTAARATDKQASWASHEPAPKSSAVPPPELPTVEPGMQEFIQRFLQRNTVPLYAAHTIVHQTVDACTMQGQTRAGKGLINAILRRYLREHASIRTIIEQQPEARWNHPAWWIELLQKAWPEQWETLLTQANLPALMILRCNTRQISRKALQENLQAAGHESMATGTDGLILLRPAAVQSIPGHAEGWWSVQDANAQLAARLLPLREGDRVLDACAAPGGKTAHLLELHNIRLTATDINAARLQLVADNLQRLQLPAVQLHCADARGPNTWWDGKPFDAILADVPCTASGIVRRHPDIRWLRQANDLPRTIRLQADIADNLWQMLAKDGHLLYATCSIFPQEGEMQAEAFLQRHPDALRLPAPGQLLPGPDHAGDGFFYALFRKAPA